MTPFGWVMASGAVVAAASAILSAYRLSKTPLASDLSEWITANELGIIERDLPSLKEVIVVADHVEEPNERLREAVIDNFKEGVQYTFLVSSKRIDEHRAQYTEYFEALRQIAIMEARLKSGQEGGFSLHSLHRAWIDYPYIFYVYLDGGERRVLAFRGDQKCEGIAEHYRTLEPPFAETMAALLTDAVELVARTGMFDDVDFGSADVLPFKPKQTG